MKGGAKTWPWVGLHVGLVLALPFILVLLFGCKKVERENAEYGPEVPGSAIDQALSKAITGATLDNVAVGQFLDHTVTRRLENEENTTTLGGTRIEVIDKSETTNEVRFTLRIAKSERMNGGSFETKITEEPLTLTKSSLRSLAPSRVSTASLESDAKVHAMARKVTRVTYHNLREFTEPLAVPKAVAARAGCGGLTPCQLEVRYIRFDMVQWYDDGSATKVALDFGFSVQPPYLPFGQDFDQFSGLLIVDCRSTYVPVESRTVYVRDCMTLEDFQK